MFAVIFHDVCIALLFLVVVVVEFYFYLLQYEVYFLCFFPSSDFEGINPIFSLLVVNLNF